MATLYLNEYRRKRDFPHSPEPAGAAAALQPGDVYAMKGRPSNMGLILVRKFGKHE